MEEVQKCEVQEQSYVPSPESFKVKPLVVIAYYKTNISTGSSPSPYAGDQQRHFLI
jgi:hypothetical protein